MSSIYSVLDYLDRHSDASAPSASDFQVGKRFSAFGVLGGYAERVPLRNVSVVGVAWGEYLNQVPGSAALFSAGLGQLVSSGLKPPAPQRYPLSEAQAAASQCLAHGGVLGKLVLEP